MQSPRISVRVSPKLLKALEAEAEKQGERLTEIVRAALVEYLTNRKS